MISIVELNEKEMSIVVGSGACANWGGNIGFFIGSGAGGVLSNFITMEYMYPCHQNNYPSFSDKIYSFSALWSKGVANIFIVGGCTFLGWATGTGVGYLVDGAISVISRKKNEDK